MRAPIVSRKHIVQHTQFIVPSGSVTTHVDALAVAVQDVNIPSEVTEGNVIKAIYVEIWLNGETNTESINSIVLMVEKSQANHAVPTLSEMSTLDAYENKKNIFYTTQGITASNTGNPTPFIRQWIKIPKSKQRFGLRDNFRISIAAIGAGDISGCGLTIYKSYS